MFGKETGLVPGDTALPLEGSTNYELLESYFLKRPSTASPEFGLCQALALLSICTSPLGTNPSTESERAPE